MSDTQCQGVRTDPNWERLLWNGMGYMLKLGL
jgi:hypothetical protein